jgi:hypothetical protein
MRRRSWFNEVSFYEESSFARCAAFGAAPIYRLRRIGKPCQHDDPPKPNLMLLTVDTSYWTRYRSRANNPDLDPGFQFPQAIPSLFNGQFPAIPRDDGDLTPSDHIQAIANTAGFHFAFIEQGGTSLYPSLAQRASSPEVLRILLSIGPMETMHFQTWQDKAGNGPPLTDPTNGLVFPDLNAPPLARHFLPVTRSFSDIFDVIQPLPDSAATNARYSSLACSKLFGS